MKTLFLFSFFILFFQYTNAQGVLTIQNNTGCDYIVTVEASIACGTILFSQRYCVAPGTTVIPDPNLGTGVTWDNAIVTEGGTGCLNPCHDFVLVSPQGNCASQVGSSTACPCNYSCDFFGPNNLDIN